MYILLYLPTCHLFLTKCDICVHYLKIDKFVGQTCGSNLHMVHTVQLCGTDYSLHRICVIFLLTNVKLHSPVYYNTHSHENTEAY